MATLEQGYAIVEHCLPSDECDQVLTRTELVTGAGTRRLLDNPWCQSLARLLRDRASEAIPEVASLVAVQCTFFKKTRTNNWFVPFHRDRSIPVAATVRAGDWPGASRKEGMTFVYAPDHLLAQMVALRLHVDDSTPDNGPLRVIPDSHRSGTLGTDEITSLQDSSSECPLIVQKGDVIAMRPLLLHASSKSHNDEHRRVLHFLFGPKRLPQGLAWRSAV